MRIPKLVVVVALSTYLIVAASTPERGSPAAAADVVSHKFSAKVRELHQERIATLKMVVEIETRLSEIGKASPEAILDAKVQVYEAEAAAAETPLDRITALQRLVDVLRECEAAAQARKSAARDTEASVLKAKANRLEAEIRWEQAQTVAPIN